MQLPPLLSQNLPLLLPPFLYDFSLSFCARSQLSLSSSLLLLKGTALRIPQLAQTLRLFLCLFLHEA